MGEEDGDAEGFALGRNDGPLDFVGLIEGTMTGLLVGRALGEIVGLCVGVHEWGDPDGGGTVGVKVGAIEGFTVGRVVRLAGALVGRNARAVGLELG